MQLNRLATIGTLITSLHRLKPHSCQGFLITSHTLYTQSSSTSLDAIFSIHCPRFFFFILPYLLKIFLSLSHFCVLYHFFPSYKSQLNLFNVRFTADFTLTESLIRTRRAPGAVFARWNFSSTRSLQRNFLSLCLFLSFFFSSQLFT